jgi:hypothetical protein
MRRRWTPPETKENVMPTTTYSLAAADRFADDLVARELTDEQALDECRLSGITLPEGEHWQYYLDAARTRRDEGPMARRTDAQVSRLANTIHGTANDAAFHDGWRTYGPAWAWAYLTRAIKRGVDRRGSNRPERASPSRC